MPKGVRDGPTGGSIVENYFAKRIDEAAKESFARKVSTKTIDWKQLPVAWNLQVTYSRHLLALVPLSKV